MTDEEKNLNPSPREANHPVADDADMDDQCFEMSDSDGCYADPCCEMVCCCC